MLPGMGGSYRRRLRQIIMSDTALVIQGKLVKARQMVLHALSGHAANNEDTKPL